MMAVPRLAWDGTLASLPPEWPEDPLPDIRNHVTQRREKIIVVDDDPMGCLLYTSPSPRD